MLGVVSILTALCCFVYFVVYGIHDSVRIFKRATRLSQFGLSLILIGTTSSIHYFTSGVWQLIHTPRLTVWALSPLLTVPPVLVLLWSRYKNKSVLLDRKTAWHWSLFNIVSVVIIFAVITGYTVGKYGPPGNGVLAQAVLAVLNLALSLMFFRGQIERSINTGTVAMSGLAFAAFFLAESMRHMLTASLIGSLLPISYLSGIDSFAILGSASMLLLSMQTKEMARNGLSYSSLEEGLSDDDG